MDNKAKNTAGQETSSQSTVDRGREAIDADKKINKKHKNSPKVQEEEKQDAEKWRNEG